MTTRTALPSLRKPSQTIRLILAANLIFPVIFAPSALSAPQVQQPAVPPLSDADIFDLTDGSPLIAKATIKDIIPLSAEQSIGAPTGTKRVFVTATVQRLIRGSGGINPEISYLYDVPLNWRGKMPKLKKRMVLLFARPGTRASEVQLSVPDGQIDWTPELEARVTDSVTKILDPAAPPRIKAVGDAFHVAGTIQGEGETQIFLVMDDGAPVSLSVIRRPDEEPSWAVALGEIVDESARAPKPGTLLWYRLTCGLPQQLPARSVRTLPTLDAEAARRDYSYILSQLGACGRTRSRNN